MHKQTLYNYIDWLAELHSKHKVAEGREKNWYQMGVTCNGKNVMDSSTTVNYVHL